MALTAEQARAHNHGARFLPAHPDNPETLPCIQLPDGRQCYFYYDDSGILNISVHLDGDLDEDVSVQVTVGPTVVFQDITDLPAWGEMSDRDKGAALMHVAKRNNEGDTDAVENYPCIYFDDPRLTRLTANTASSHATRTVGDTDEIVETIGQDEYERLYDIAYDADRAR